MDKIGGHNDWYSLRAGQEYKAPCHIHTAIKYMVSVQTD